MIDKIPRILVGNQRIFLPMWIRGANWMRCNMAATSSIGQCVDGQLAVDDMAVAKPPVIQSVRHFNLQ